MTSNTSYIPSASILWLIIIIWGIYKCTAIAKREETSSKCIYSLLLTLSAYGAMQLHQIIKFQIEFSRIWSVFACFTALVAGIAAVILAIIGLMEYGQAFYTQGRKQAIWSIGLSVLMISMMFVGFFVGFSSTNADSAAYSSHESLPEPPKYAVYESDIYGYRVDLSTTAWRKWETLKQDFPAAETGGLLGEDYGFIIIPFAYNNNRPGQEAVLSVLLRSAGMFYPSEDIGPLQPLVLNGKKGFVFTSNEVNGGRKYSNQHWFLEDQDRAWLISVWCRDGINDLENKSKEVIDGITFFPSLKVSSHMNHFPLLSKYDRQVLARHYNQIGLFYFQAKSYTRAISYFKDAFSIFSEKPVYLVNAMKCFYELNQSAEAIVFYDKYAGTFASEPDLKLWKAWFLKELDQNNDAVAIYRDVFGSGIKNDDDFISYIDVLQKLALKDEIDQAFSQYLKDGGSHSVYIKQAEVLYAEREFQRSNELLEKISENKPFSPDIIYRMIWNYYAMEQFHKVIELCDQIEEKGYSSADAYFYKAKAQYDLKWYGKAKITFEKVLDYDPQDKNAQDYIKHISGLIGEGDNSTIREEIAPVPLSDPLIKSIAKLDTVSHSTEYDSEYIYRVKGFDFISGKKLKYTHYWKIVVNNESGVNRFSTLTLSFNPLYEKLFINSLAVKNSLGEVVSKGVRSDFYLVDSAESGMATHEQTLNMPVSGLQPGYTIELTATVESLGPQESFMMVRQILFSSRPVHLSALFYRGDTSIIQYKSLNGAPAPLKDENGLTWMLTNPQVYKWEPHIAPFYTFMPMVWISETNTGWTMAGGKYLNNIENKLILDSKTRKLANQLTQDMKSRNDKIVKLASYVQSSYTYKPIEFGRRAQIPNSALETISRKYGDCKDHAVLLQQLLRAEAIDSYLVLISTEYSGDPLIPTIDQFNHMINYIPLESGGIFIDTTDKSLSMGRYLPVGLAGHYALILDPKNIRLHKLEDYDEKSCRVKSATTLSIVGNSTVNLKNQVIFTGYAASFMRENLKDIEPTEYLQWGRNLISSYFPWVNAESVSVENLYENNKDLVINSVVKINDICSQIDNKLITQLPTIWELYYLSVKAVNDRETPFSISYPFFYESEYILDIPQGYEARINESVALNENSSFGFWITNISQDKEKVTIQFKADLHAGYFEKQEYTRYQKTLEKAIRSLKQTIQLESKLDKTIFENKPKIGKK